MNITIIGEAILVVLQSWKSGEPLLENIVNLIVAFSKVSNLSNSPLLKAVFQVATEAEAGNANLQNGQAAVIASDTIDGVDYTAVIVKNNSTAGAALGLGVAPVAASGT